MDTALDGKKIRMLIYEPRNCSENLPCLYFIHGGRVLYLKLMVLENEKQLKIQTDRRMITQSYWKYTDTPMCNSKDMRKYLKMYVKDLDESKLPYLSLAEAPSLIGQPSACIETAEYDCLHDKV